MTGNELRTICRFSQTEEAHLWKTKLESEGIPSAVAHDTGMGSGYVELQVRASDVARASRIVEPVHKTSPASLSRAEKRFVLITGCIMVATGMLILLVSSDLAALVLIGFGGFMLFVALGPRRA
ncbi:MAG: DUF2007 domain-containing protein [Chloroflexi bacterium]|nr:DUF2007 domain-containing protein [Chloroflexota bacterium]